MVQQFFDLLDQWSRFIVGWIYVFSTHREKAEKEAAERAKLQAAEESDDGVVVGKVR